MSPRSRPPARRRRYCHHTAVLGTRRTRCGSHAACTSHTASASPVLAVASNSIPTYLQKGLRERVNKKSLLRRRRQFSYRGSHPGRHHGSRNLCRLTRPVPWQLRRASADGSCRTERPPRAPAGHPRAERRPRGAVPVVAACANVGSVIIRRRTAAHDRLLSAVNSPFSAVNPPPNQPASPWDHQIPANRHRCAP